MTIDWWTLGIQTVNVAILVWLLQRFFWRPVAAMIELRRTTTQAALDDAQATKAKATAALAHGLVNEVVAPDQLDAAVDRWLADILACAPLSLRAIKQTVRRTAHLTPSEAQALRLPALIECLNSADGDEGVRAFLEKRAPIWTNA